MTVYSHMHPWLGFRKFERHSLVLVFAGVIYMAIGLVYLVTGPSPYRTQGLYYALQIMGYHQWGAIFVLSGGAAVLSSRWPPLNESWGYILLTGLSTGWATFYAAGVIFHDTPPTNIIGALCYGLLGFMWWAISGLVNPTRLDWLAGEITKLQNENLELHRELARLKIDGEE